MLAFFAIVFCAKSQFLQDYLLYKQGVESYLDSLKNFTPDSVVSAEGSVWSEYNRYKYEWDSKMASCGNDKLKYYDMLEHYRSAFSMASCNNDPWREILNHYLSIE